MSSENATSINQHPNHSQTRSEAASPSTSFFTPPRPRPHPKYHYIHSADGTVTQKKLRPRTSSPHVVSRLLSFNASSVFMRRMVEEQHLQRSTKSDTNESNPSSSTKSSTSPSTSPTKTINPIHEIQRLQTELNTLKTNASKKHEFIHSLSERLVYKRRALQQIQKWWIRQSHRIELKQLKHKLISNNTQHSQEINRIQKNQLKERIEQHASFGIQRWWHERKSKIEFNTYSKEIVQLLVIKKQQSIEDAIDVSIFVKHVQENQILLQAEIDSFKTQQIETSKQMCQSKAVHCIQRYIRLWKETARRRSDLKNIFKICVEHHNNRQETIQTQTIETQTTSTSKSFKTTQTFLPISIPIPSKETSTQTVPLLRRSTSTATVQAVATPSQVISTQTVPLHRRSTSTATVSTLMVSKSIQMKPKLKTSSTCTVIETTTTSTNTTAATSTNAIWIQVARCMISVWFLCSGIHRAGRWQKYKNYMSGGDDDPLFEYFLVLLTAAMIMGSLIFPFSDWGSKILLCYLLIQSLFSFGNVLHLTKCISLMGIFVYIILAKQ